MGKKLIQPQRALENIQGMVCDYRGPVIMRCPNNVTKAPRLYVPSKTQQAPGHDPVRIMTTMHFCEDHVGTLRLDDYLTDGVKYLVEQTAKKRRPIDWKPDFDAAFLHYVDIFSDEYKQFLRLLQLEHTLPGTRDELVGPIHDG